MVNYAARADTHLTTWGSPKMSSVKTFCSQTSMSDSAAYAAPSHRSMNASPAGEFWSQKNPLHGACAASEPGQTPGIGASTTGQPGVGNT